MNLNDEFPLLSSAFITPTETLLQQTEQAVEAANAAIYRRSEAATAYLADRNDATRDAWLDAVIHERSADKALEALRAAAKAYRALLPEAAREYWDARSTDRLGTREALALR